MVASSLKNPPLYGSYIINDLAVCDDSIYSVRERCLDESFIVIVYFLNTTTSRITITTTAQAPNTEPIITPVDTLSSLSIMKIHKQYN